MPGKVCSEDAPNNEKLKSVSDVEIDEGKFKYVLIKVKDPATKDFKHIVKGFRSAGFHADIYEEVEPKLAKEGLKCSCPGGGRIQHNPAEKTILVYGYSQGYGQADHKISVEILKTKYPDYGEINFSNDGY